MMATVTMVIPTLLLLSVPPSTSELAEGGWEPWELACPDQCTCHLTPRAHVPIVRWHETGDRDEESEHHWNYYHHHEGLNHDAEDEEEVVKSAVCVLQRDTDASQLMSSIPPETQFLSLLQSPDLRSTYLQEADFRHLTVLQGLEIQGYHQHETYSQEFAAAGQLHGPQFAAMLAQNQRHRGLLLPPSGVNPQPEARITLSDTALRGLRELQYVNLEYVRLSPGPSATEPPVYHVVPLAGEGDQPQVLSVQQQPEVVPYEQLRDRLTPRYSSFANITTLRFLRLAHAELEELTWSLFQGLDSLEHLVLEHQPIKTLPDFAFFGCPNLRHLSLADNQLLDVNMKQLAGLLDLEVLDLSNNFLSQLSYISLAPFPRLRELDVLGNPLSAVYPGTFEMMNKTEILSVGSAEVPVDLLLEALKDLPALRELTVANLSLSGLAAETLAGLPGLTVLRLHGSVPRLQFDTFSRTPLLEQLDLSRCQLEELSQDTFLGLTRLRTLDLSHNQLQELPSELFSPLSAVREIYLHHNQLSWLSADLLGPVRPKLLQLHHNPWECNCQLAFLSAAMTNKARSTHAVVCQWDEGAPGGRTCKHEHRHHLTYDVRMEPRCHSPPQYRHWGLYEVLQRELRCHTSAAPAAPPAGRSRHYQPPDGAEHEYDLLAPEDIVLLDDLPSASRQEADDYADYDMDEYDEAGGALHGSVSYDEPDMAEYSADDYPGPEETDAKDTDTKDTTDTDTRDTKDTTDSATTDGYVTVAPELFARMSKKARKLEMQRMNPKFRKYYNL